MNANIPRRNDILRNTPTELAIRDAVDAVERAGCHPKLTQVVNLLTKARETLADWEDARTVEAPTPRYAGSTMQILAGLALAFLLMLPSLAPGQAPKPPEVAPPNKALIIFEVDPPDGITWVNGTKFPNNRVITGPLGPGFWKVDAIVRWCDGQKCVEQKLTTPNFQTGQVLRVKVSKPGQAPPAPATPGDLPGALVEAAGDVNFGINIGQLAKQTPESCSINGQPASKEACIQAMAGAAPSAPGLPDDRKNLRLTVIGDPEFRRAVAEGLAQPEAAPVRERLVMQSYTPDAWAVKEAGFAPGNQIYLQAPDGKVLHRQTDFAGGAPKLIEAVRKVDPSYKADRDPDLRNAAGEELTLLALLAAAAFLAWNL